MSFLRELLYSPVLLALVLVGALALSFKHLTRAGSPIGEFSSNFAKGLGAHAKTHVLFYMLTFTLASSATADAIGENFGPLTPAEWKEMGWWQIAALFVKSLKPAFVAISALLVKPPIPIAGAPQPSGASTNAPFPPTSTSPTPP